MQRCSATMKDTRTSRVVTQLPEQTNLKATQYCGTTKPTRGTRSYHPSACPLSRAHVGPRLPHAIIAMGSWAPPSRLTHAAGTTVIMQKCHNSRHKRKRKHTTQTQKHKTHTTHPQHTHHTPHTTHHTPHTTHTPHTHTHTTHHHHPLLPPKNKRHHHSYLVCVCGKSGL